MSHYSEVVALLDATGFTVRKGHVPAEPSFPYAVLWWPGVGRRSINSLEHVSGRLDVRFTVTSVALSDQGVQIVAEAVQNALLDVSVTVAGWVTYPIRGGALEVAIQEDRDITDGRTNLHPLYTVASYQLAAEIA